MLVLAFTFLQDINRFEFLDFVWTRNELMLNQLAGLRALLPVLCESLGNEIFALRTQCLER